MAVREISTKLVMQGEREYREAITGINREYKTLESSLRLIESQFKGQQNTLGALEAKNKALNDMIGKQTERLNAERSALSQMQSLQERYAQAAEKARDKLSQLASSTDDAAKETQEYKDKVAEIQKEIAKYESAEEKAAAKVELHTRKANDAQVGLNNLNGELSRNEKHLDEARDSADGCARSIDEYGKEVKEAADQSEDFGEKGKAGVDALAQALAAAGVVATVKQIGEALMDAAKASIEFESAFAGVKKTVDASDAEYAKLSDSLKEMSTRIPSTTTDLAGIMEMAGQLGVRGTGNLEKFTETIAALDVATNLTREDAATMLAQFANITGMDIGDIDRLGSVIVDLGNNFATTESSIVTMGQRLAGAGSQVGMNEAEIMAFATALSSVGIEAEAGGSAFSKLMVNMQVAAETGSQGKEQIDKMGYSLRDLEMLADKDGKAFKALANSYGMTSGELKKYMAAAGELDSFAQVSGMTAEQFAKAYGEDATGAILSFLTGLNEIDASGESAIVVLDQMGITEVRLRDAILRASGATDLFTDAQNTANRAWEENTALQKEAAERYGTTESKIEIFKNSVNNLKIAIGDELTPTIRGWVDTGTDVMQWAENLVRTNPELVQIVTTLLGMTAAFVGVVSAIALVKSAFTALSPMLTASPWIIAAGAIAAAGVALLTIAANSDIVDEDLRDLQATAKEVGEKIESALTQHEADTQAIEATAAAAKTYLDRLTELEGQASRTNTEQFEYELTLEKLKTLIPDLNLEIDEQTGLLKEGADAIRAQVDAWKDSQHAEAALRLRTELIEAEVEAETHLLEAQLKKTENDKEIAKWTGIKNEKESERAALLGLTAEEVGKLSGMELANLYQAADSETQEAWTNLSEYIGNVGGSLNKATQEGEVLDEAITMLNGDVEKTQESLALYDETMGLIADDTGEAASATNDYTAANEAFAESAAAIKERMDELNESYVASYEAAYKNISASMGLFDEMEVKTDLKVKDMIAALDSQIAFMDTYAENIKRAAELGIDEGLLAKLSDGSVESAAILQEIVKSGGENIEELNAKFAKVEEGKQTFATTVAEMETDFTQKAQAMQTEMNNLVNEFNQSEAARTNTAATVDAAIAELKAGEAEIQAIVSQINATLATVGEAASGVSASAGKSSPKGSHAAGLAYVPEDGYLAELHRGERVLTALEAKAYRAEQFATYALPGRLGDIVNNSTSLGGITIHVHGGADSRNVAKQIAEDLHMQLRHKGVVR